MSYEAFLGLIVVVSFCLWIGTCLILDLTVRMINNIKRMRKQYRRMKRMYTRMGVENEAIKRENARMRAKVNFVMQTKDE